MIWLFIFYGLGICTNTSEEIYFLTKDHLFNQNCIVKIIIKALGCDENIAHLIKQYYFVEININKLLFCERFTERTRQLTPVSPIMLTILYDQYENFKLFIKCKEFNINMKYGPQQNTILMYQGISL